MVSSSNRINSVAAPHRLPEYTKVVVIATAALCLGLAIFHMPPVGFSLGMLLIVAFSVLVAPRMSIRLPSSNFTLSFSDSVVILSFILYGGEIAILVAFIETLAASHYLKRQNVISGKWMILFNGSMAAVVMSFSYSVVLVASSRISFDVSNTANLVTLLGLLALSQFFASSVFASFYQYLKTGDSIWETWKKQCLSSSLTQFTGAGLAGVAFKIINYADIALTTVVFLVLTIAYVNYRKLISEISSSIANVEKAEREKADAERDRRREAERYSEELSVALQKEERANLALRKSEKDFQHAALHDSLTGLANRKQFGDILRRLIHDYKEDPSLNFQVLFLDIRSFKNINDSLGHTIGDKVLIIAAKRFVRMLNPNDTVARIGGDEFAIILRDLSTVGKAQKVARRIYDSITQPFSLSGNTISIDLNIGIAPCDTEYDTPEEILRDADIAMHYAKEKKNGLGVFTKELRARFLKRVRFEMDLRHALHRDELILHYQPIISLSEGRIVGFEALLRWHHKEFGLIPPSTFIPIAEDSGLIQPITVWILQQTTNQLANWQKISPRYKDLMVSVNISGKHLATDDLIDDVENALLASTVEPSTLKLEITESSAMENPDHTVSLLRRLKHLGVQLSIDDFGTGYSSLSYLQRLPFDTLKIDRSFVSGVGDDAENSEILQTIISLAKNLRMRVIAEGIETESQLAVLQNLGCDFGQGYLLAKPVSRDEAEKLLYSHGFLLPQMAEHESSARETSRERKQPATPSSPDRLPVF